MDEAQRGEVMAAFEHRSVRDGMNSAHGFTLIEIMVTIGIVAILAAIALPSYQQYVVRSQLVEAHTQLASMRVKVEQYYQDSRTYVGACTAGTVAALPGTNGAINGGDLKYFSVSCPTLTATSYTVRATGAGNTAGFVYTIDQANTQKTTAAPAGWTIPAAPTFCWITRKSGC
jgi:type IV pilus assembly protein PilE